MRPGAAPLGRGGLLLMPLYGVRVRKQTQMQRFYALSRRRATGGKVAGFRKRGEA